MKNRTHKALKIISIALAALILLTATPALDFAPPLRTASFWVLSCTWGVIATVAGGVQALIFMHRGLEPKFLRGSIYFENVREKGSNNLGPFFFLGEDAEYYTPYHEAGHGMQNILLGPLYVVVVGISSEIWYRKFTKEYAGELASGTWDPDERRRAYDRNPIERWATNWGARAYGLEMGQWDVIQ